MRALAHDDDAVGQFQRLFLVVGDEDRRVAGGVVDLAQPAAQFAAHLRVERAERLVEQQHAAARSPGAGQRHALALAARKLRRIALFQAGKLDEIEQFRGAAADLGCRPAASRRGRTLRPKPILSATVMWRNSA